MVPTMASTEANVRKRNPYGNAEIAVVRIGLHKGMIPMLIRKMMPKDLSAIARVNVDTFRATQQGIVPHPLMDSFSMVL